MTSKAFYAAGAPQLSAMFDTVSHAAFPVWKDSTRGAVKFAPLGPDEKLSRRMARKIWNEALRWERKTRQCYGQGAARSINGKLSRVGLLVLRALLFEFLNHKSGRLDPSYAAIADKACVSLRSVGRALVRLKQAGILHWLRRCSDSMQDGRYILEQESNAYGIAPPTQWKGYTPAPEPPPPDPQTWGARPPMAAYAVEAGDTRQRILQSLEGNPDPAAQALARLGRGLGVGPRR